MRKGKNHLLLDGQISPSASPPIRILTLLFCACLLILSHMAAHAQTSTSQTPLSNPVPRPTGITLPAANRAPDANDQMEMREQQTKKQNFAAANAERKKQIADDSAKLLKLAADLKAEVDRTGKDTLSLSVIRKADEIERLAHIVKEKMKLTVGGS
jgi:hypothetical protein